jgi:hypothetical protein
MEPVGLTRDELVSLIFAKIAEKSIEVEREAPPHSTDIYHWIEHLLGHHTQVWILALADILDENNKRIAQQLSP